MATRPSSTSVNESHAPPDIYQLKITLQHSKPPIWRRVQVRSSMTLGDLHEVIQLVFGWEDAHLHSFEIDSLVYGLDDLDDVDDTGVLDETSVRLADLFGTTKRMRYTYDFGDSWHHLILLEKTLSLDPSVAYPICVTGRNACPPEDCGGIAGYDAMLEVLGNPRHPERASWVDWLGGTFDPNAFSLEEANALLSSVRPRVGGRRPLEGTLESG